MRRFLCLVLLAGTPSTALAAEADRGVTLNGERIDSVRGQRFEKVDVFIDADGNVHIQSDTYKVEKVTPLPPPNPAPTPALPKARFFLISEERALGSSQYDFDVFLNGNLVKTVRSGEPPVVEDVSRLVAAGTNTVTVTARKNFGAGRKSESKDDYQRIYLGQGTVDPSGTILIQTPDVDYRRTAADVLNFVDQLTFTLK